jgi:hypothetical protein
MELWAFHRAPLTLIYTAACISMTMTTSYRLCDPLDVSFSYPLIAQRLQVYRAFTSLFSFIPFELRSFMNLLLFITHSLVIESKVYVDKPADFLLFSIWGWICIWAYAAHSHVLVLGDVFAAYLIWYASKRLPDTPLALFGIEMPCNLDVFPIAYLATFYRNEAWKGIVAGFAAGHFYFFVQDVLGRRLGVSLLSLPNWINHFFKNLFSLMPFANVSSVIDCKQMYLFQGFCLLPPCLSLVSVIISQFLLVHNLAFPSSALLWPCYSRFSRLLVWFRCLLLLRFPLLCSPLLA